MDTQDEENKNVENTPRSVGDLSRLYPRPKTYDQLEQERVDRQQDRLAREPRWQTEKISLALAVLAVVIETILRNSGNIVMFFGAFAGVFLLFAAGLLLLGCAALVYGSLRDYFYKKSTSPLPVLYAWTATTMACATLVATLRPVADSLLLVAISFITARSLVFVALTTRLTVLYKAIILITVPVASLTGAVAVSLLLH